MILIIIVLYFEDRYFKIRSKDIQRAKIKTNKILVLDYEHNSNYYLRQS
jgi:hypothetical protein